MITEQQVKDYLPKIFNPVPNLSISYIPEGQEVIGSSLYSHKTDSYLITISMPRTTPLSITLSAVCHEGGHILLDRKSNNPGDHFRSSQNGNTVNYVQKEVSAWIEGGIPAQRLKIEKVYKEFARNIMAADVKYMRNSTRQLWEGWLNG
jgi:hypothetical protein